MTSKTARILGLRHNAISASRGALGPSETSSGTTAPARWLGPLVTASVLVVLATPSATGPSADQPSPSGSSGALSVWRRPRETPLAQPGTSLHGAPVWARSVPSGGERSIASPVEVRGPVE